MRSKTQARCLLVIMAFILLLVGCSMPAAPLAAVTPEPFAQTLASFEVELEVLRQEPKIPGLSAAVVKDGQFVWARGLGFADVENRIPATPEMPYHLASVTRPFAALVIMQLVQDGKLSLDRGRKDENHEEKRDLEHLDVHSPHRHGVQGLAGRRGQRVHRPCAVFERGIWRQRRRTYSL